MNIFINKIHILICSSHKIKDTTFYEQAIDFDSDTLNNETLRGNVLVSNIDTLNLISIIKGCIEGKFEEVEHFAFVRKKPKLLKTGVKSMFELIDAAGGLIEKDNKYLLIKRLGKWDLPKGKMEEDEKFKETALREVAEECSIKASLVRKITTTWHYYEQKNGTRVLKRTKWYLMTCLDNSQMTPQKEEDIEDIAFFDKSEAIAYLKNSYKSISFVFQQYLT